MLTEPVMVVFTLLVKSVSGVDVPILPVMVMMPEPCVLREAAPLISPVKLKLLLPLAVVMILVEPEVSVMAPVKEVVPVPCNVLLFKVSASFTPVTLRFNVLLLTLVVPVEFAPNACALFRLTVPLLMVVVPVYVLAPPKFKVPLPDLVSVLLPAMMPL